MAISLGWLDEAKSELLTEFDGAWTWEDFHRIVDESTHLFAEGGPSVSSVIDFSGSSGLPSGAPFPHARRAFKMYEAQPNFSGYVVAITTRPITLMIARMMIATGIARNLIVARSRDEGLKLLRAKPSRPPRA